MQEKNLIKASSSFALMAVYIFSSNIFALEIENLKSGAFCEDRSNSGKLLGICSDAQKSHITRYGCKFGSKDHPCLITGFEFDYKNKNDSIKIKCKKVNKVKFDDQGLVNNLHGLDPEALTVRGESELEIPEGEGHLMIPVTFDETYPILGFKYSVIESTVCYQDKNKIIESVYQVIHKDDEFTRNLD